MASGIADYGVETWLSALFGLTPVPTGYYVALCSSEPGATMDGDQLVDIEPADTAYVRQHYGVGPDYWGINGAFLANTDDILYPAPTVDWGDVTHFALCSAVTSGQIYAWSEMVNPTYVATDVGMLIPAGGLILGLHSLDDTIAA